MSAIAGIINLNGKPVDPETLRSMAAVVDHRGPDGNAQWVSGAIGMANLHLATTHEAERERLPLVDEQSGVSLVWDGRLDNRSDLVGLLAAASGVSSASTDSELVLAAYLKWGAECPARLVGDYAFALWDDRSHRLVCARDPLGVRQFFYHYDGRRIAFGTEIKQILQVRDVPRRLNETLLGLYMCGSMGDAEMTFYLDVHRLPGGYVMVVDQNGLSKRPFWDPDPANEIVYATEKEYLEQFRELMFQATLARLRSNRPPGVMLSGGLDSGTIASIAGVLRERADITASQVPTAFFMTYRNPPFDEAPYVRAVCERFGLRKETISVDDTWAMQESPVFRRLDEPFASPFEAMQCRSLETARSGGVRVLLTGEGGDEAFHWGYMPYLTDWVTKFRFRRLVDDFTGGTPEYRRLMVKFLRRNLVPGWYRKLVARHLGTVPGWVDPAFAARVNLAGRLNGLMTRGYRESDYTQSRGTNPFFMSSDTRTAWYGIEMRHPFWDSRLVEFMVRIPATVRVQGGRSKLLLKKSMAGIVPSGVLNRTPYGAFGRQMDGGFRKREGDRIERQLAGSFLGRMGAVNASTLLSVYRAFRAGDASKFDRLYWTLITEDWFRQVWPSLVERAEATEELSHAPAVAV